MSDDNVDAPAGNEPAEDKTTAIPNPGAEQKPEAEKAADPADKSEAKTDDPKDEVVVEGEDDGEGDEPKRPNRSQRTRRKLAQLAAENAELRRSLEERRPGDDRSDNERPRARDADDGGIGREDGRRRPDEPPKEADFNGDYLAFERALNAWNVRDAVRKEVDRARSEEQRQRQAEAFHEQVAAHEDRIEEARERIADFDTVVRSAAGLKVEQRVVNEILDSEKSALLQYYLAKNPDKLRELNGMSGRALAREIGRLESRVHLPKPKQATGANPPLSQPRGGAAPAFNPSAASMEDYVAKRKAGWNG